MLADAKNWPLGARNASSLLRVCSPLRTTIGSLAPSISGEPVVADLTRSACFIDALRVLLRCGAGIQYPQVLGFRDASNPVGEFNTLASTVSPYAAATAKGGFGARFALFPSSLPQLSLDAASGRLRIAAGGSGAASLSSGTLGSSTVFLLTPDGLHALPLLDIQVRVVPAYRSVAAAGAVVAAEPPAVLAGRAAAAWSAGSASALSSSPAATTVVYTYADTAPGTAIGGVSALDFDESGTPASRLWYEALPLLLPGLASAASSNNGASSSSSSSGGTFANGTTAALADTGAQCLHLDPLDGTVRLASVGCAGIPLSSPSLAQLAPGPVSALPNGTIAFALQWRAVDGVGLASLATGTVLVFVLPAIPALKPPVPLLASRAEFYPQSASAGSACVAVARTAANTTAAAPSSLTPAVDSGSAQSRVTPAAARQQLLLVAEDYVGVYVSLPATTTAGGGGAGASCDAFSLLELEVWGSPPALGSSASSAPVSLGGLQWVASSGLASTVARAGSSFVVNGTTSILVTTTSPLRSASSESPAGSPLLFAALRAVDGLSAYAADVDASVAADSSGSASTCSVALPASGTWSAQAATASGGNASTSSPCSTGAAAVRTPYSGTLCLGALPAVSTGVGGAVAGALRLPYIPDPLNDNRPLLELQPSGPVRLRSIRLIAHAVGAACTGSIILRRKPGRTTEATPYSGTDSIIGVIPFTIGSSGSSSPFAAGAAANEASANRLRWRAQVDPVSATGAGAGVAIMTAAATPSGLSGSAAAAIAAQRLAVVDVDVATAICGSPGLPASAASTARTGPLTVCPGDAGELKTVHGTSGSPRCYKRTPASGSGGAAHADARAAETTCRAGSLPNARGLASFTTREEFIRLAAACAGSDGAPALLGLRLSVAGYGAAAAAAAAAGDPTGAPSVAAACGAGGGAGCSLWNSSAGGGLLTWSLRSSSGDAVGFAEPLAGAISQFERSIAALTPLPLTAGTAAAASSSSRTSVEPNQVRFPPELASATEAWSRRSSSSAPPRGLMLWLHAGSAAPSGGSVWTATDGNGIGGNPSSMAAAQLAAAAGASLPRSNTTSRSGGLLYGPLVRRWRNAGTGGVGMDAIALSGVTPPILEAAATPAGGPALRFVQNANASGHVSALSLPSTALSWPHTVFIVAQMVGPLRGRVLTSDVPTTIAAAPTGSTGAPAPLASGYEWWLGYAGFGARRSWGPGAAGADRTAGTGIGTNPSSVRPIAGGGAARVTAASALSASGSTLADADVMSHNRSLASEPWRIYTLVAYSPSLHELWEDGVLVTRSTLTLSAPPTALSIAGMPQSYGSSLAGTAGAAAAAVSSDVRVAEVMIFKAALGLTARASVELALARRHGLVDLLPPTANEWCVRGVPTAPVSALSQSATATVSSSSAALAPWLTPAAAAASASTATLVADAEVAGSEPAATGLGWRSRSVPAPLQLELVSCDEPAPSACCMLQAASPAASPVNHPPEWVDGTPRVQRVTLPDASAVGTVLARLAAVDHDGLFAGSTRPAAGNVTFLLQIARGVGSFAAMAGPATASSHFGVDANGTLTLRASVAGAWASIPFASSVAVHISVWAVDGVGAVSRDAVIVVVTVVPSYPASCPADATMLPSGAACIFPLTVSSPLPPALPPSAFGSNDATPMMAASGSGSPAFAFTPLAFLAQSPQALASQAATGSTGRSRPLGIASSVPASWYQALALCGDAWPGASLPRLRSQADANVLMGRAPTNPCATSDALWLSYTDAGSESGGSRAVGWRTADVAANDPFFLTLTAAGSGATGLWATNRPAASTLQNCVLAGNASAGRYGGGLVGSTTLLLSDEECSFRVARVCCEVPLVSQLVVASPPRLLPQMTLQLAAAPASSQLLSATAARLGNFSALDTSAALTAWSQHAAAWSFKYDGAATAANAATATQPSATAARASSLIDSAWMRLGGIAAFSIASVPSASFAAAMHDGQAGAACSGSDSLAMTQAQSPDIDVVPLISDSTFGQEPVNGRVVPSLLYYAVDLPATAPAGAVIFAGPLAVDADPPATPAGTITFALAPLARFLSNDNASMTPAVVALPFVSNTNLADFAAAAATDATLTMDAGACLNASSLVSLANASTGSLALATAIPGSVPDGALFCAAVAAKDGLGLPAPEVAIVVLRVRRSAALLVNVTSHGLAMRPPLIATSAGASSSSASQLLPTLRRPIGITGGSSPGDAAATSRLLRAQRDASVAAGIAVNHSACSTVAGSAAAYAASLPALHPFASAACSFPRTNMLILPGTGARVLPAFTCDTAAPGWAVASFSVSDLDAGLFATVPTVNAVGNTSSMTTVQRAPSFTARFVPLLPFSPSAYASGSLGSVAPLVTSPSAQSSSCAASGNTIDGNSSALAARNTTADGSGNYSSSNSTSGGASTSSAAGNSASSSAAPQLIDVSRFFEIIADPAAGAVHLITAATLIAADGEASPVTGSGSSITRGNARIPAACSVSSFVEAAALARGQASFALVSLASAVGAAVTQIGDASSMLQGSVDPSIAAAVGRCVVRIAVEPSDDFAAASTAATSSANSTAGTAAAHPLWDPKGASVITVPIYFVRSAVATPASQGSSLHNAARGVAAALWSNAVDVSRSLSFAASALGRIAAFDDPRTGRSVAEFAAAPSLSSSSLRRSLHPALTSTTTAAASIGSNGSNCTALSAEAALMWDALSTSFAPVPRTLTLMLVEDSRLPAAVRSVIAADAGDAANAAALAANAAGSAAASQQLLLWLRPEALTGSADGEAVTAWSNSAPTSAVPSRITVPAAAVRTAAGTAGVAGAPVSDSTTCAHGPRVRRSALRGFPSVVFSSHQPSALASIASPFSAATSVASPAVGAPSASVCTLAASAASLDLRAANASFTIVVLARSLPPIRHSGQLAPSAIAAAAIGSLCSGGGVSTASSCGSIVSSAGAAGFALGVAAGLQDISCGGAVAVANKPSNSSRSCIAAGSARTSLAAVAVAGSAPLAVPGDWALYTLVRSAAASTPASATGSSANASAALYRWGSLVRADSNASGSIDGFFGPAGLQLGGPMCSCHANLGGSSSNASCCSLTDGIGGSEVAELLVFRGALSADSRAAVEGMIAAKYALRSRLLPLTTVMAAQRQASGRKFVYGMNGRSTATNMLPAHASAAAQTLRVALASTSNSAAAVASAVDHPFSPCSAGASQPSAGAPFQLLSPQALYGVPGYGTPYAGSGSAFYRRGPPRLIPSGSSGAALMPLRLQARSVPALPLLTGSTSASADAVLGSGWSAVELGLGLGASRASPASSLSAAAWLASPLDAAFNCSGASGASSCAAWTALSPGSAVSVTLPWAWNASAAHRFPPSIAALSLSLPFSALSGDYSRPSPQAPALTPAGIAFPGIDASSLRVVSGVLRLLEVPTNSTVVGGSAADAGTGMGTAPLSFSSSFLSLAQPSSIAFQAPIQAADVSCGSGAPCSAGSGFGATVLSLSDDAHGPCVLRLASCLDAAAAGWDAAVDIVIYAEEVWGFNASNTAAGGSQAVTVLSAADAAAGLADDLMNATRMFHVRLLSRAPECFGCVLVASADDGMLRAVPPSAAPTLPALAAAGASLSAGIPGLQSDWLLAELPAGLSTAQALPLDPPSMDSTTALPDPATILPPVRLSLPALSPVDVASLITAVHVVNEGPPVWLPQATDSSRSTGAAIADIPDSVALGSPLPLALPIWDADSQLPGAALDQTRLTYAAPCGGSDCSLYASVQAVVSWASGSADDDGRLAAVADSVMLSLNSSAVVAAGNVSAPLSTTLEPEFGSQLLVATNLSLTRSRMASTAMSALEVPLSVVVTDAWAASSALLPLMSVTSGASSGCGSASTLVSAAAAQGVLTLRVWPGTLSAGDCPAGFVRSADAHGGSSGCFAVARAAGAVNRAAAAAACAAHGSGVTLAALDTTADSGMVLQLLATRPMSTAFPVLQQSNGSLSVAAAWMASAAVLDKSIASYQFMAGDAGAICSPQQYPGANCTSSLQALTTAAPSLAGWLDGLAAVDPRGMVFRAGLAFDRADTSSAYLLGTQVAEMMWPSRATELFTFQIANYPFGVECKGILATAPPPQTRLSSCADAFGCGSGDVLLSGAGALTWGSWAHAETSGNVTRMIAGLVDSPPSLSLASCSATMAFPICEAAPAVVPDFADSITLAVHADSESGAAATTSSSATREGDSPVLQIAADVTSGQRIASLRSIRAASSTADSASSRFGITAASLVYSPLTPSGACASTSAIVAASAAAAALDKPWRLTLALNISTTAAATASIDAAQEVTVTMTTADGAAVTVALLHVNSWTGAIVTGPAPATSVAVPADPGFVFALRAAISAQSAYQQHVAELQAALAAAASLGNVTVPAAAAPSDVWTADPSAFCVSVEASATEPGVPPPTTVIVKLQLAASAASGAVQPSSISADTAAVLAQNAAAARLTSCSLPTLASAMNDALFRQQSIAAAAVLAAGATVRLIRIVSLAPSASTCTVAAGSSLRIGTPVPVGIRELQLLARDASCSVETAAEAARASALGVSYNASGDVFSRLAANCSTLLAAGGDVLRLLLTSGAAAVRATSSLLTPEDGAAVSGLAVDGFVPCPGLGPCKASWRPVPRQPSPSPASWLAEGTSSSTACNTSMALGAPECEDSPTLLAGLTTAAWARIQATTAAAVPAGYDVAGILDVDLHFSIADVLAYNATAEDGSQVPEPASLLSFAAALGQLRIERLTILPDAGGSFVDVACSPALQVLAFTGNGTAMSMGGSDAHQAPATSILFPAVDSSPLSVALATTPCASAVNSPPSNLTVVTTVPFAWPLASDFAPASGQLGSVPADALEAVVFAHAAPDAHLEILSRLVLAEAAAAAVAPAAATSGPIVAPALPAASVAGLPLGLCAANWTGAARPLSDEAFAAARSAALGSAPLYATVAVPDGLAAGVRVLTASAADLDSPSTPAGNLSFSLTLRYFSFAAAAVQAPDRSQPAPATSPLSAVLNFPWLLPAGDKSAACLPDNLQSALAATPPFTIDTRSSVVSSTSGMILLRGRATAVALLIAATDGLGAATPLPVLSWVLVWPGVVDAAGNLTCPAGYAGACFRPRHRAG